MRSVSVGISWTLAALLSRTVSAQTAAGGIFVALSADDRVRPDSISVRRGDRQVWVRRGRRVEPIEVHIASTANANDQYNLWVVYRREGRECPRIIVVLPGSNLLDQSNATANDRCDAWFSIDAATARAAARVFATPIHNRIPVGPTVAGRFATSQTNYAAGDPIEIHLTLQNAAGASPVFWFSGGRNRGLRDNQFSFEVTRDGQRVAPIDAPDFGGLGQFMRLEAGTIGQRQTRLEPWADFSSPGHYVVACHFTTELSPGDVDPMGPHARDQIWDRVFDGVVAFDVRSR